MKSYKYRNEIYTISQCTVEDIPSHLERVSSYLDTDELISHEQRMKEAVNCDTAYKLVDSNGNTKVFAYYEYVDYQIVNGIALWWTTLRMFAIFGVWFRSYTDIRDVYIVPHKNNLVSFQFLVTDDSMKGYHFNGTPLILDMYTKKCDRIVKLYEAMDVEEV